MRNASRLGAAIVVLACLSVGASGLSALGDEIIIYDHDVVRVGFGPGPRLALVKHDTFMNRYSIEDHQGHQIVNEWDNPIYDAAFLPNGLCVYLRRDDFFDRLEVKTENGTTLWQFYAHDPVKPTSLSFADDGEFYFVSYDSHMGWYRVVDKHGSQLHTTFNDRIEALSVTSREVLHIVLWDRFRERYVLEDRRGVRLHVFDRHERPLSIHVRGNQLRYAARDTFFDRLVVRSLTLSRSEAEAVRQGTQRQSFRALHSR